MFQPLRNSDNFSTELSNKQLELLANILEKISYSIDPDEVILKTIELLSNYFEFDIATGFLETHNDDFLKMVSPFNISDKLMEQIKIKSVNLFRKLSDKGNKISERLNSLEENSPQLHDDGLVVESYFFTPIFNSYEEDAEIMGLFFFGSFKKEQFSLENIQFMFHISNKIGQQIYKLYNLLGNQQTRTLSILEQLNEGVILLNESYQIIYKNRTAQQYLELLNYKIDNSNSLKVISSIKIDEILSGNYSNPVKVETIENGVRKSLYFEVKINKTHHKMIREQILSITDVTLLYQTISETNKRSRLEAIGSLSAGISHDFNNILTSVIGFAEILNEQLTNPKQLAYVSHIKESGKKGEALVRQITDFARTDQNIFYDIDLSKIVQETVSIVREALPKRIKLTYQLPDRNYFIKGSSEKIFQIVSNLINNARDAIESEGNITISVRETKTPKNLEIELRDTTENWILLSIKDNGVGIDENIIDKIFNPFFTTKTRTRGTGLGLSQVQGIVAQHDGYIDVKSQINQGTEFRVFFPKVEISSESPVNSNIRITPKYKIPLNFKASNYKILIIEDDPNILKLLVELLQSSGFTVSSKTNGYDAWNYLRKTHNFDLIISDIVMPKMNGLELMNKLRDNDIEVPMIFMSGYPYSAKTTQLPKNLDIMSKPINSSNLMRRIVNTLMEK